MRIGIDISPVRPPRTGVGNYCYYLLKHLLRLAPEVTFRGFISGAVPIESGALPGPMPYRFLRAPTRALYAFSRATGRPRVDSFLGGLDVYHATNYYLLPTRSARRALTIHDLGFLVMPETSSPKIRRLFAQCVPEFARAAESVLTCSESTRRDVIQYCGVPPERVAVTYYAVDEELVPWDRNEAVRHIVARYPIRSPYLLFVGTLEPRKNIPALIRAFASAAKDIPHTLVLAGPDGWNMDAIRAAIAASGLESRIFRAGYVADREMAALYSGADAFVFPSLYEGFGFPPLEAMTCGCPVICANNSSMPELVGDAALMVDARDVDGLADAIQRILNEPALREELIRKGRRRAAGFSWAKCAAETLDIYRHMVEG